MKKTLLVIMLLVGISVLAGCLPLLHLETATKDDQEVLNVDTQSTLTVESLNGDITVEPATDGNITVDYQMFANGDNKLELENFINDSAKFRVEITKTNAEVSIKVILNDKPFNISAGVNFTVYIPAEINNMTLKSSNGNISATSFNGVLRAASSNGDVNLSQIKGDMTIDTSNGSINGDRLEGTISNTTFSGNRTITIEDSALFTTELGSTNGTITVETTIDPNSDYTLTTSNGDIEFKVPFESQMSVNASTSNGDAACELPIDDTAIEDNKLIGDVNGGGAQVELKSTNGDINILEWVNF